MADTLQEAIDQVVYLEDILIQKDRKIKDLEKEILRLKHERSAMTAQGISYQMGQYIHPTQWTTTNSLTLESADRTAERSTLFGGFFNDTF